MLLNHEVIFPGRYEDFFWTSADAQTRYSGLYVDTMYYIPLISVLGPVMAIGYFSFPHVISAEPADMICSFTSSLRDFHSNSSGKSRSADMPSRPQGQGDAWRSERKSTCPCRGPPRSVVQTRYDSSMRTMELCMYVCMYVHIYVY